MMMKLKTPFGVIRVGDINFDITYNQLTGFCGEPISTKRGTFFRLILGEEKFNIFVDEMMKVERIEVVEL